jgi:hypothetical protein
MLIPGVLKRREHRRIDVSRVGQLVQNQEPALCLELRGDSLPEIRPAREHRRAGSSRIRTNH